MFKYITQFFFIIFICQNSFSSQGPLEVEGLAEEITAHGFSSLAKLKVIAKAFTDYSNSAFDTQIFSVCPQPDLCKELYKSAMNALRYNNIEGEGFLFSPKEFIESLVGFFGSYTDLEREGLESSYRSLLVPPIDSFFKDVIISFDHRLGTYRGPKDISALLAKRFALSMCDQLAGFLSKRINNLRGSSVGSDLTDYAEMDPMQKSILMKFHFIDEFITLTEQNRLLFRASDPGTLFIKDITAVLIGLELAGTVMYPQLNHQAALNAIVTILDTANHMAEAFEGEHQYTRNLVLIDAVEGVCHVLRQISDNIPMLKDTSEAWKNYLSRWKKLVSNVVVTELLMLLFEYVPGVNPIVRAVRGAVNFKNLRGKSLIAPQFDYKRYAVYMHLSARMRYFLQILFLGSRTTEDGQVYFSDLFALNPTKLYLSDRNTALLKQLWDNDDIIMGVNSNVDAAQVDCGEYLFTYMHLLSLCPTFCRKVCKTPGIARDCYCRYAQDNPDLGVLVDNPQIPLLLSLGSAFSRKEWKTVHKAIREKKVCRIDETDAKECCNQAQKSVSGVICATKSLCTAVHHKHISIIDKFDLKDFWDHHGGLDEQVTLQKSLKPFMLRPFAATLYISGKGKEMGTWLPSLQIK